MSPVVLSLVIVLPLLGATLNGLLGLLLPAWRKQEALIGWLATAMVAVPFFILVAVFASYSGEPVHFTLLPWMATGGLEVSFGYSLDQLSLLMGLIVTGIGTLIHIYSIGYMHHDGGFYKFFTYLNLFIFAMNNLILGDNLLVTFLGWEGVGACSYFLIGFWYSDMEKSAAAQKAFVANRIGDFAFLVAMFLIFWQVGSLNYGAILSEEGLARFTPSLSFWVALLLFIAATGKSAQIPLYVWLPDAMAGPTPVSALIHAATMVTSGIYLIARTGALYVTAPEVMTVVALVGAATALLAALIAIAQNDIKKVLAYSTVSQLGFMFMALGAGAFSTAIFHVMTHAFFKACLFLGSGSVIHAMEHAHAAHDPQDIRTMGGLKKYMPSTFRTFVIATIAIAGIPPLAGFFSKDEILAKNFALGLEGHTVYYLVWGVGIFTALLTAFYMTRLTYLTFYGKERYESHAHHPHESGPLMTVPLWVLAALAIVGGWVGLPEVIDHGHLNWISHHWLAGEHGPVHNLHVAHPSETIELILIALSIAIAGGGVLLAWGLYKKHDLAGDDRVVKLFGGMYRAMQHKFYVDEFYNAVLIRPLVSLAQLVVIPFDQKGIDGVVDGTGKLTTRLGGTFKKLQTGIVQNYAVLMAIGIVVLLGYMLFLQV
ncbi:MAG: NADH-quinone oxidoreductase subunit L [Bacteroidia bacterium]|nr:NADH-quinone oxidoreductase subunit L [Bacteroidia bacterium]